MVSSVCSNNYPTLVEEALVYATEKHKGQKRKWGGQDYVFHPIAVADMLISFGISDEKTLAAALLHDVVEDTDTTIQDLREKFGERVAELVWWLTDYKSEKEGNRETRKAITNWKIVNAPLPAILIKLADIIDNGSTIKNGDVDFYTVFVKEKNVLLEKIMSKYIDKTEWRVLEDLYHEAMSRIT